MWRVKILKHDQVEPELYVEGEKQSVVDALRAWCDRNDENKKVTTDVPQLFRDFFGMK
jgi:hypothetical protein